MKAHYLALRIATLSAVFLSTSMSFGQITVERWRDVGDGSTIPASGLATSTPTFGDSTNSSAQNVLAAGDFGTDVVLPVGETLTVSGRFNLSGGSNSRGNYRFGVFNDGGQFDAGSGSNWTGGWNHAGGDFFQARTDGVFLSIGGDASNLGATENASGSFSGDSGADYSFSIAITQSSATEVSLVSSLSGGDTNYSQTISAIGTSSNFTYNTFGFLATSSSSLDLLSFNNVQYTITSGNTSASPQPPEGSFKNVTENLELITAVAPIRTKISLNQENVIVSLDNVPRAANYTVIQSPDLNKSLQAWTQVNGGSGVSAGTTNTVTIPLNTVASRQFFAATISAAPYSPATRIHNVSLNDAHKGNLAIDTELLDSFGRPQEQRRSFYLDSRDFLASTSSGRLNSPEIVQLANEHAIPLMGGPMLGDVSSNSISIWFRPSFTGDVRIIVSNAQGHRQQQLVNISDAGVSSRIRIDTLDANSEYAYALYDSSYNLLGNGAFKTAPTHEATTPMRVAFGADFHKVGVHNSNLFHQILARGPTAMFIYGDIAVDGRKNRFNMIASDYLLRDTSEGWGRLAAHLPIYTSWDDWDYYANDISGLGGGITETIRDSLRETWQENWINPAPQQAREGIYFSARIGPVEYFMLDTRSCRENQRQGEFACFLGPEQHTWLKQGLQQSTAPFKIISSGTMWSDYVSAAKDSWGTWDIAGREDLFSFIETEKISGVLLVSGDRHGARGFRIPRASGYTFYEFGIGSLGGVNGPTGNVGVPEQIFGYGRNGLRAFGEFTFTMDLADPEVTLRLINDEGTVLETHTYSLSQLTP